MKAKFFLFALLGLFLASLTSCEEEDPISSGPEIDPIYEVFNYDGPNDDAPQLIDNVNFEAAVRFAPSRLAPVKNGKIAEIHFYIKNLPNTAAVKIYSSRGGTRPGTLLYEADVLNSLSSNSWNKHVLAEELFIGDDDIWIAIAFSHINTREVVGCDPGPATINGDWLFDELDGQWLPLSQRSIININWNIRLAVEP